MTPAGRRRRAIPGRARTRTFPLRVQGEVVGAGVPAGGHLGPLHQQAGEQAGGTEPEPVGGQPVIAGRLVDQHQVEDGVLGRADPAGRLDPYLPAVRLAVVPDRLQHHQGHREGGRRAHLPGRGLDEIGPGQHRQPGGAAHVVQRDQLAGLQDHLEVGIVPADLVHRGDLVEDQPVLPGEERAAVDHHVDLVGARRDRRPDIGQLHVRAAPAAREGRGDAGHVYAGALRLGRGDARQVRIDAHRRDRRHGRVVRVRVLGLGAHRAYLARGVLALQGGQVDHRDRQVQRQPLRRGLNRPGGQHRRARLGPDAVHTGQSVQEPSQFRACDSHRGHRLALRSKNWLGGYTLRLARSAKEVRLAGDEGQGYGSVRLASAAGRWVLAVAVLGDSMILLEATVVNVALPTIGRNLGASVAELQWTLNSYVLALAALVLVGGSLSDIYGRRRMFVLGVVVFVAASALCAAAPTIGLLIAARFVQGIGGGLLTPGSLAIIEAVFHPDDRTRAIGAWAGLGAVAGAIGPTVGGYLTDAVSWGAIFPINLPLGGFVVVAAVLHVPEPRDAARAGGPDLPGAALAMLAIGGVCFALIQASGGFTPVVIAAFAVGLVAAGVFVAVERRARHPMLPLELFRSRQFASATVLALVTYAALGGVIFLFVAFLQTTLGYTALQAGAATLPITILLLTLSTPSGAIAQRIGPRIPLTVGAALAGAGLLLMAQLHPGDRFFSAVLPALIVFGVGLGVLITPITATVLASVDAQHSGIASAVNNALSRLGQMIAVAALPLAAGLSGSAFEDPARMAAGFPVAMYVAAGAAFAAALFAWTTISDDVLGRPGPEGQRVPRELPRSLTGRCPVAGTPLAPSLNSPSAARPTTPPTPVP